MQLQTPIARFRSGSGYARVQPRVDDVYHRDRGDDSFSGSGLVKDV